MPNDHTRTHLWSNNVLCIPASVADAASVNPNSIKTVLANGLSTFFIKKKIVFSSSLRNPPKNPSDCTVLDSWAFDNIILADEPFPKAFQS